MTIDPRQQQGALRPISPPVSQRRTEVGGIINDTIKPMTQAAAVGLAVVNLVASFLVLCIVAGETAFWIVSGVVAATSFLWSLRGVKWRRSDAGDRVLHLIATGLLTGITGYIAQCVAIVSAWGVPAGFLKVPPFAAFLWFVFAAWYFPHLEVNLGQRLLIPSMFQDRYGWRALASWLEWRLKKERPTNHRQPIVVSGRPIIESPTIEPPPPVEERTGIELFLMLAQEYETLRRDGSDAGYGLAGKIKGDGRILTKPEWKMSIDWLAENDWIEKRGISWEWKPGATAEVALKQVKY